MITLSKSGNTIVFEFDENSGYLQNGTIEVPLNSLSLVIDESDMATFKKSATNDIFVSARYEDFGKTKAELESWYEENMVGSTGGGGGVDSGTVQTMIDSSISGKADSSAVTEEISAAVSGKVDTVYFNVYSAATSQLLSTKVDNDRYTAYTAATSQLLNTKADSSAVTEEISEAVSGKVDTVFFNVYSAATSQLLNTKVDNDRYTAYTAATDAVLSGKAETTAVTESIAEATSGKVDTSDYTTYTAATEAVLSGKQDTLSAGTNITIVDNVISATGGGGGKAIEGGRGITVTTGETADTVSLNIPISAGTGVDSVLLGNAHSDSTWMSKATAKGAIAAGLGVSAMSECSFAFGYLAKTAGGVNKKYNFAHGYNVIANGSSSHAEGTDTISNGSSSHAEGKGTKANNYAEHASGQFNNSVSASTTFGNSGNTLFSVGNGTADNARHNAFEIRQNGDIYLNDGTNDVRLQDTILALGGLKLQQVTQAEYDALVSGGTVDANTLYIITNVVS